MSKLSERVPDPSFGSLLEWRVRLRSWLKELAEVVEFIDRREQFDICHPHKQFSEPTQEEYQPQTYDEAIALCKGWKRCVMDGFVHWETSKGAWWVIDPNDKVGFCEADYENYNFSWERNQWPDLWKEMIEAKIRHLYLSEISDEWVFNLDSRIYTDSTPGRVVCQVYLVYKGHADWAERLSADVD